MYYIELIDDYSKKTLIFFMKTKDEASNWFRVFKAQVENQIDKIKVLRSNNGDEYTSNDFKNFCKDARIKKDMIVSYNPH